MLKRKIDSKYEIRVNEKWIEDGTARIQIVNSLNGNEIPEDEPAFIFRAKDRLAIAALVAYYNVCKRDKCTNEQLDSLNKMISEFKAFAELYPDKMKQPGSTMPDDLKKKEFEGYGGSNKVEPPLNE